MFLCLGLCWVFNAVHGLTLVVESRGSSPFAVRGLLIAGASLCCGAWALGLAGSVAVARA